MMDEAVKLAKERLLFAAIDGDSAHTEGAYVKQWVMIANCYTKLLTTTHKQIEFLRQER